MKCFTSNSGQTLIEVLIAFATLAVIITSTTLAVVSALSNAQFVKNQHQAIQYAQQGMEMVRSMRENNYNAFLQLSNPNNLPQPDRVIYYCMAKSCTQLEFDSGGCGQSTTACTAQNVDSFVRGVSVDRTKFSSCWNPDFALNSVNSWPSQITVNVGWTDGQCPRGSYCHTVSVTSCLSPINEVATP